jgi:hypothetical protein
MPQTSRAETAFSYGQLWLFSSVKLFPNGKKKSQGETF